MPPAAGATWAFIDPTGGTSVTRCRSLARSVRLVSSTSDHGCRVVECDCEPGYILHWRQAALSITVVESIAPDSTDVTVTTLHRLNILV